jgi:hypothetical protein
MTDTVQLKKTISSCNECPNRDYKKYYTADSFENVQEWVCTANENWRITLHDWNDATPPIPAWCPLRDNVRAKREPAVGRQARAGENVPRTARPGLVACRWRSA